MRIKRLTLAGFGPYKDEQHVDFESFDDDGIFLITGKTGAGKSSILDAICYALYASVPRYDSTQQQLRSDHSLPDDPSFVELEFTVNDVLYRVRRTPEFERPKQRGSGTTRQATTAQLDRRNGEVWEGIASRAVDVALELEQIVGLSKDQFLQVILLAQNRFQKFLQSGNDDRQAVLRSLFGTRRFEQIEATLVERRKSLEGTLASARDALAHQATLAASLLQRELPADGADLAWLEAARVELEELLVVAMESARVADAASGEADAAFRALETTHQRQLRRDAASARLATLTLETDAIDTDRRTLGDAHRSATVWGRLTARREAGHLLEQATATEEKARTAWLTGRASGAEPVDGAEQAENETGLANVDLARVIDTLTRQLGGLEAAIADEERIPSLASAIAALQKKQVSSEEAIVVAFARREELPTRIDHTTERATAAQVRASAEKAERESVERLQEARDAAARAAKLETQLTAALTAEKTASGAHLTASQHLDDLLDARLSGNAADLASKLVAGEPCAVCGSLSHPAPASWDGTPVNDADIDVARDALAVRREQLDATTASARVLATSTAEATAASSGRATDEIDTELAGARVRLDDAGAAAHDLTRLNAELDRLRDELSSATSALESLQGTHDASVSELAALRGEHTALVARVAEHRGQYSDVASRVADLKAELRRTRTFADARTATATAGERLQLASAALDLQLTTENFTNEDAAVEARQSPTIMAALEARIRQHEQAVAAAAATLSEPDLVGLPAAVVEVAPARLAAEAARTERDAARDVRSGITTRFESLDAIVTGARAQHEASAALQQEFAALRELSATVEGNTPNTKRMRLETYVLAAQLEEIVKAANARLRTMTSGRFELEHNDGLQFRNTRSGLGLSILDQHTGRSRATHSLSGGETFLASLALALGLAEVVTNQAGGITLDTLFIDEGFGSLDADTLEIAMSTLDSLRAGGRTIGLISHVDTMKEQIHAKLRITVTEQGYSEIS